jgi:nitroimidazol reductase NimA-like FMN-containing flavoprotein (pyridoxamine 5'-phosphate oxidase superfamily)
VGEGSAGRIFARPEGGRYIRRLARAPRISQEHDLPEEANSMNIVAADPHARVLSEDELLKLLAEPIVMHLGMVDEKGWPVVNPVWHVFENGVFHLAIGKTSHKAKVLRANRRAYFTVDQGGAPGSARGVRGRANVRIVDGDADRAVDLCHKELIKYTGTDKGGYAEEMLGWARGGEMSIVLTPSQFRAFAY